jgi:hypothetical protein
VSTIEELLERNNSGSGLESREYGRGDPLRRPRDILYQEKLAVTAPKSGCRSGGIVHSRTKATGFGYIYQHNEARNDYAAEDQELKGVMKVTSYSGQHAQQLLLLKRCAIVPVEFSDVFPIVIASIVILNGEHLPVTGYGVP